MTSESGIYAEGNSSTDAEHNQEKQKISNPKEKSKVLSAEEFLILAKQTPPEVEEFLAKLELETKDICAFRGEPREWKEVTSGLYRWVQDNTGLAKGWEAYIPELEERLVDDLNGALAIPFTDQDPLRIKMQHFGCKTNLIDFTWCRNVALFFACLPFGE